jgi:D-glycero-alpha-D-manno-heptose 1-phosphate guanylyltransferase
MVKEAIILAGGLGTRLRSVLEDIPKPMAKVNGKPFLEYIFYQLKNQGIDRMVLSVQYKWHVIKEYFGTSFEGIEIKYSVENEPLGTGGAILLAIDSLSSDDVLVLNGDTFFDIDLRKLFDFHTSKKSKVTLALKRMKDFDRYGVIEIDKESRIVNFLEKQYRTDGLINGGIYVLNREFFTGLNVPHKFSFEKDFLEKYYKKYEFYGLPFDDYFVDIGVPEDYERAKRDFEKFEYK